MTIKPAKPVPRQRIVPHAATLDELADSIGLPGKTLGNISRSGKGPPIFRVGKRIYCRVVDFNDWLDRVAAGKVDASLTPRKRRPRP